MTEITETEITEEGPNTNPSFSSVEFIWMTDNIVSLRWKGLLFARVQHEKTYSTSSYYISRFGPEQYDLTDEVLLVWAFRASEELKSERREK